MSRAERFILAILCFFTLFIGFAAAPEAQEHPFQQQDASQKTDKDEGLLARIWDGVQEAQKKYLSGCGKISETRKSKLLNHAISFHGRFCASGTEKFDLEYFEPERLRLVFNQDYLNVTTGKEKQTTEVLKIGADVARTQKYLSGKNSLKNLKDNFFITIQESPAAYILKFVPRSQRFKQKINYVKVTLRKSDFLLSKLEIDGKNGVNSLFTIEVENFNQNTGKDPYDIYIP
jgi:hypothetical protein